MNTKEKKKDRYYRNRYNISYDEYKRRDEKNKHKCEICTWKPSFNKKTGKKHNALAIDHWHKLEKLKIITRKVNSKWKAYNIEFNEMGFHLKEARYTFRSSNRRKAKKQVRLKLKRIANRGLVCWRCNSGLKKFKDNAMSLIRAGKYMQKYLKDLKRGTVWN